MTGIAALLTGGGLVIEGTVSINIIDAEFTNENTATATYSLRSSGDLVASGNANTTWIDPRTGMANFEVRATPTFGSATSGTVNSWLSLSVNRSWSVTRNTGGTTGAGLLLEIRKSGGDGTILASQNITISANVI